MGSKNPVSCERKPSTVLHVLGGRNLNFRKFIDFVHWARWEGSTSFLCVVCYSMKSFERFSLSAALGLLPLQSAVCGKEMVSLTDLSAAHTSTGRLCMERKGSERKGNFLLHPGPCINCCTVTTHKTSVGEETSTSDQRKVYLLGSSFSLCCTGPRDMLQQN